MEDEEVGDTRALRRIRSATKAAALVNDYAAVREGAVAIELAQLPPKLLVVCHYVKHPDAHLCARRLQDRSCLCHLLHTHEPVRRPVSSIHRGVQRLHVGTLSVAEGTVSRHRVWRWPRMVVGEPKLWLTAIALSLVDH